MEIFFIVLFILAAYELVCLIAFPFVLLSHVALTVGEHCVHVKNARRAHQAQVKAKLNQLEMKKWMDTGGP